MLLKPSEVLRDRYRVIGLLGQGGMAAVYCAHDRTLDRLVAVKQLRPDPFASEKAIQQARDQFQREAQILATLDHPNLPRVTDYFESHGVEYLAMDYVEGQTLSDLVEKNGTGMDEAQVLEWADQLLSALEYIHRHGIIHRDVKPSNIRLTPDGRIFLVDFGLVKLFDASNPKTATMMHGLGTPEYAPPEQYDSHLGHTDARSDVYALGATMYHLLTGRAPATATQRVSDPGSFRAPRALGAQVSPDIERAIMRAMELPRARRYASAAEMRAVLQHAKREALVEGGLTRRLPSWSDPVRGLAGRRIASIAVIAILVIGLGGAIGLAGGSESTVLSPSHTATPTATSTLPPTDTPSPSRQPSATLVRRTPGGGVLTNPTEVLVPSVKAPASPTMTLRPTMTPSATVTPSLTSTSPPVPRLPTDTPTSTLAPTATLTPSLTPTPPNTPTPTQRITPGVLTNTPAPTSTPGSSVVTTTIEPTPSGTP